MIGDSAVRAWYTSASCRQGSEAFATPQGTVVGKRATTGDRGPVPLGQPVKPEAGRSREGRRGGGTGHRKRRLTARPKAPAVDNRP